MNGQMGYQAVPNLTGRALLASTTVSTTGTVNYTAQDDFGPFGYLLIQFNLTAAATLVGHLLDVKVETTIDGTNWKPIVWFPQVVGNGGTKTYWAKVSKSAQLVASPSDYQDMGSISASAVVHGFGDQLRVTSINAVGGSFTFSVYVNAIG